MSGTSLDGISAAAVRFTPRDGGTIEPSLVGFVGIAYTPAQRAALLRALTSGTAQEYCRLGFDLGTWFADAAVAVLAEAGVSRSEVRAIGSHGQTAWHEAPHSTWQIGESAVIAERLGIDVVSDFRVRDVAAGGQGAPLVPIADALLFSGNDWRALQNIGGIGNVTIVPPNGQLDGVRAFDTGPGVAIIDGVTRTLVQGETFDRDGLMAARGSVIASVVDELLQHPYFASPPPKSTGRELFDRAYIDAFIDRCRSAHANCSTDDIIATATSLTARTIGDAYRRFMPEPVTEVLASGGGAKNPTLFAMIEREVAPMTVREVDARIDAFKRSSVQAVSNPHPSTTAPSSPSIPRALVRRPPSPRTAVAKGRRPSLASTRPTASPPVGRASRIRRRR
jgi:anhydro-N-acetylmuramic acid kinase